MTPIEDEEQRLVREAQQGGRDAFLRLIEPYRERVHATAIRLLGNADDAVEVTQEAILRTFWKIQSFHGHAHFYTWLYRTALNLCYRKLSDSNAKIQRRSVSLQEPGRNDEGSAQELPLPSRDPSPRDDAIQAEEAQIVRKALAHLDKKDFEVLVLREFEELSYDQIAQRLHLSQGTVMSRLHRARQALGRRLEQMGIT